jgi:hypothetical protein
MSDLSALDAQREDEEEKWFDDEGDDEVSHVTPHPLPLF